MTWFTYEQQPIRNVFTGPARTVFVEANTAGEADARATAAGLPFHADAFSCCGARFNYQSDVVWEKGDAPTLGGREVQVTPVEGVVAPGDNDELGEQHRGMALLIPAAGEPVYGRMQPK